VRAQELSGPIAGSGSFTKPGVAAMEGCAMGHFWNVRSRQWARNLDSHYADQRSDCLVRSINPRPLFAVEQPEENGRPDGQDVKKTADDAADGNNEAKTDGEGCRTYQTDYHNQGRP
jgi:hypothetical protein